MKTKNTFCTQYKSPLQEESISASDPTPVANKIPRIFEPATDPTESSPPHGKPGKEKTKEQINDDISVLLGELRHQDDSADYLQQDL